MLHSTNTREAANMSTATATATRDSIRATLAGMVETFLTYAGPDFTWAYAPRNCERPTSAAKRGLRRFVWEYVGGRCTFCDAPVSLDGTAADRMELCHLVARGPKGINRGWFPGNIAGGCISCNIDQKNAGRVVDVATIMRPEAIPFEWPTMPELKRDWQ